MNLDDEVACVEKPSSNFYAFKVLQGPFTGVIYTYGKVQIKENLDLDQATLKFDFKIDTVPMNLTHTEVEESADFKNYIGDILALLIEEKTNNDESANDST